MAGLPAFMPWGLITGNRTWMMDGLLISGGLGIECLAALVLAYSHLAGLGALAVGGPGADSHGRPAGLHALGVDHWQQNMDDGRSANIRWFGGCADSKETPQ